MKDVKTPLQMAFFQLLDVDLYDVAPTDAEYPFTEIGESFQVEDMDKSTFGQETIFTFHIRDRFQGSVGSRAQINSIRSEILETLRTLPKNGFLEFEGFKVTAVQMESSDFNEVQDDTYLYFTESLRVLFRTYELV